LIKISKQNIRNKYKKNTGGGSTSTGNGKGGWTWKDLREKEKVKEKYPWSWGPWTDGGGNGTKTVSTTNFIDDFRKREKERVTREKYRKNILTNWNEIKGNLNTIASTASYVRVMGDRNIVSERASSILIQGNNNIVKPNLRNVTIIGNDTIATKSDTTYINGVEISTNEGVVEGGESGWLYSGGVNEVQNPFGNTSLITNIVAGRDTVQEKGGFNSINYLNCGVDSNNDLNDKPL
jgi:hypothetical protein